MDTEKGLQVIYLSCVRQQQALFARLSFAVNPGEILLIEGPNGSGKSSLLRLLSGLSTPHEGDILWQGKSIHPLYANYGCDLHYLGHTNGIKLGLTVIENMQLACQLASASATQPYDSVLFLLQLHSYKNTLAKYLSAGQKRKLAFARLLLIPKPLWILDEPFTALDTASQEIVLQHLATHLSRQGICILSSHQPISFKHAMVKRLRLGPC